MIIIDKPFIIGRKVADSWEMFTKSFATRTEAQEFLNSQPKGTYSIVDMTTVTPDRVSRTTSTVQ